MKQIPFYSKRNQVYPVLWRGRAAVEKHFAQMDDWRRESALYVELSGSLPLPEVLSRQPGMLVLEYRREPTLLEELERQEAQGFDPAPWRACAAWLRQCHGLSGQLPEEGNLRNFLWDAPNGRVIGLDLECCGPDTLERCGARMMAAILAYTPENTAVKQRAAGVLAEELSVPGPLAEDALRALRIQRGSRRSRPISGVILAGGASRRMGQNKAGLQLLGKTLLQHQVDKLSALGIQDIMLSGKDCPAMPGVRVIPDEYPGKGPLGGLHACLRSAQNPACLVVSVDAPLIPAAALARLCQAYSGGILVLYHGGWDMPLLGVYDRGAAQSISAQIKKGKYAVRALQDAVRWNHFDYAGPEELLINCNTPEDFDAARKTVEMYASAHLPIL